MRILVTGSNGLVGSRLVRLLTSRGHLVSGLDRGDCSVPGFDGYRACELTRADQVDAAFDATKPEAVIHTAAITDVDGCEKDRALAYAVNTGAAANVAAASARHGTHVVHVSTDYVFDGDRGGYSEEDAPNPRGTYAHTKWLGEEAVRVIAPSWAIARTAVVFDWPPAARPNFGAWIVQALGRGDRVRMFADQYVSPTLASSLAEMLVELAERRLTGIWHTTGADVVNRAQFAEAVCDVFGFDRALVEPTRMADAKLPSPRPARSGLSVSKASAALQAKPISLHEALVRFHAAWKDSQFNGGRGS